MPGSPFVGVADDVFLVAGSFAGELPLHARGKTGAAAAAQARSLDFLDHRFRGELLAEYLFQGPVAAGGQDLVDVVRVDGPGLVQDDAALLAGEPDAGARLFRGRARGHDRGVVQVGDHPPFEQVLLDDARHVLFPDVKIIDAVGVDGQDHPFADQPDAAALQDLDLVLQLARLQLAFQPPLHLQHPGLHRAFVDREQDMGTIDAHLPLLSPSMIPAMRSGVRLP